MYNYIYNTYIYIYIYYTRTFIDHCHKYLHIYIIYANQLQVYVCRISATGLPLKKLRMAAIWFRHGPWNTNRPTINISLLDSAIHPCIWLTSGPSMKEMVWHHPKVYFCRRWEEREREAKVCSCGCLRKIQETSKAPPCHWKYWKNSLWFIADVGRFSPCSNHGQR